MGRGRGKGRKHTLTVTHEDLGSGEEEKVPAYRRRGRPQKPLKDDIEEEAEQMDEDVENVNGSISGKDMKNQTAAETGKKRRKRSVQVKETIDSVKDDENDIGAHLSTEDSTKTVGFRLIGSRRKNKPRRAAEVGVEC